MRLPPLLFFLRPGRGRHRRGNVQRPTVLASAEAAPHALPVAQLFDPDAEFTTEITLGDALRNIRIR